MIDNRSKIRYCPKYKVRDILHQQNLIELAVKAIFYHIYRQIRVWQIFICRKRNPQNLSGEIEKAPVSY